MLTLSHFFTEVIYIPGFKTINFYKVSTKLQPLSLSEGFKPKIFFNVTLIINTFLSKSTKNTL